MYFKKTIVINYLFNNLANVVRLVGIFGNDTVEIRAGFIASRVGQGRGIFLAVLRNVA